MLTRQVLNQNLDNLARAKVQLVRRSFPAFQICGVTGFGLGILLAMSLVSYLALSMFVIFGLAIAAVLAFLSLVMATKIITGQEKIIYYHHEIALMIMAALFLWVAHQPILPYLDITILGIGTFLFCGRIGCLMVGCCHGRPSHWGVCYRKEHAAVGFPEYFIGVRLFPIQLIESVWVFGVVLVGVVLIILKHPPGETLAWYIIAYDSGRFCFEFVRGDAARPYRWGFSEPQWISLLLMCPIAWVELFGVLPLRLWHIAAMTGIVLAMIAISLSRRFRKTIKHQVLHPRHIKEVAEAVDLISSLAFQRAALPNQEFDFRAIPLACTSLGIQISADKIKHRAGYIDHFALSSQKGSMTQETAHTLAALILQLRYSSNQHQIVHGKLGIFHLLIDSSHLHARND